MSNRHSERLENRERLGEMIEVLRRNEITKGISPEKLCAIIEELGPTFIKLGQILSMRSDFLPKVYCDALTRLRTDVQPMPYEQVVSIVESAYGQKLDEVFNRFDDQALGSASIAQVHAATLKTGEKVVVKVQREGIHDVMNRDIALMKKAAELLKYTPAKGLVDFNCVLDEMWVVAQQEMNFLTEAQNLERFSALNSDVAFVDAPKLYRQYTTATVLVMEDIEGIPIDDREALTAAGYDLAEIGAKLTDNYVRQITEDGFFHADPHPGNLRVRDGKIVFLDMGMMGELSERDQQIISRAVEGVARNDAEACMNAVLQLGAIKGTVDRRRLFRDCEAMLDKYAALDLGSMDLSAVMSDMMEIMKANRIGMPGGLSMLVRGLATIEGVVVDISPNINVAQVATARISRKFIKDFDWQSALARDARAAYESATKSLDIPALLADALRTAIRGDGNVGVEHHIGTDMGNVIQSAITKLCAAVICAALLLGAVVCRAGEPVLWGLSWVGIVYLVGAAVMAYVIFFHVSRK